jgi:hypothetical protein
MISYRNDFGEMRPWVSGYPARLWSLAEQQEEYERTREMPPKFLLF